MMRYTDIGIALAPGCRDLPAPRYHSACGGGVVIYTARDIYIQPMDPIRVMTTAAFELPPEIFGMIGCHRSQAEIGMMVAPEIIGADDRGPVHVLLTWITDRGRMNFIAAGAPIAEIAFSPLVRVRFSQKSELRSPPGLPRDPVRADTDNADWG